MSNNEKKFKKKKERERRVRKEILANREKTRRETKEREMWDREENANKPKAIPINAADFHKARKIREAEVMMQLEHNMKVLKALEEEYKSELANRQDYMQQLQKENNLISEK